MAAVQIAGDLSVFTVDSGALLTNVMGARIAFAPDTQEGSPVVRMYRSPVPTKRSASISGTLNMDRTANTERVTSLAVSLFSVGAQAYIGYLESGSLSVNWDLVEASGVNDLWKYPVVAKKSIVLEGSLFVPATAVAGSQFLPGLAAYTALDTTAQSMDKLAVTAAVTIDGVAVSFPALLTSFEHVFSNGDVQKYSVRIEGKAPYDTTAYPTGPTGTSTRLEKVLNTTAAVAFTFTTHASEGVAYTGNCINQSYSASFSNGALLTEEHTWASQGTITQTPN